MPNMLAVRQGIPFIECLNRCLHTPELVQQWERLSGKKLVSASPIERAIDEATGYDIELIKEFAEFVYEFIFLRF